MDEIPKNPPAICPYYGVYDDPLTQSMSPDVPNYCHRADPPGIVRGEHAEAYCTTMHHTGCPIYTRHRSSSIPKDLRSEEWVPDRKPLLSLTLVMVALLVIGLIAASLVRKGWPTGLMIQSAEPTATNTPRPPLYTATPSLQPSASPTLDKSVSPQPTTTYVTPTLTPSKTSIPTQGPLLETPFGSQDYTVVIHKVVPGDNLILLTTRYRTTEGLIRAVNQIPDTRGLLLGELVIIMPGQSVMGGVGPLKPIYVSERVSLYTFAQVHLMDDKLVRQLNGIEGDYIEPGRWVVIQAEKK